MGRGGRREGGRERRNVLCFPEINDMENMEKVPCTLVLSSASTG